MAIAYCFTAKGYFAGSVEDRGFPPHNSTSVAPGKDKAGFVQKFDGKKWTYVENHKGENGYVDGKPFEMKDYGPLPKGFSTEAPEPTEEEKAQNVRAERDGKLAQTDYLIMPDYPIDAKVLAAVKEYRQALRDITKQDGFPDNVTWPSNPINSVEA